MSPMLRALLFIFGALAALTLIFYLLGIYSVGPME
jgi:hypothetical protein